jgi:hypothetical protein
VSSTQSQANPAQVNAAQIEQERLQIAQLDAMMISAFKAQQPPQEVRDNWDAFINSMKRWKGIE